MQVGLVDHCIRICNGVFIKPGCQRIVCGLVSLQFPSALSWLSEAKTVRTRSKPSSALFSAPLNSIGEHNRHSSMRLGVSRRVWRNRFAKRTISQRSKNACEASLLAGSRFAENSKRANGVNSNESRYFTSAVIRSHPVMALNMAELAERSAGRFVQMFASFP